MKSDVFQKYATDTAAEYHIVPTNGTPAIRFSGALAAEVSSYRKGADRYTRIKAYVTEGGNWVVVSYGETEVVGETRYVEAHSYSSEEDMTRALGTRSLACSLYDQLGFSVISVR